MARYIDADLLVEKLEQHFDVIRDEENGRLLYSDHICVGEDCDDLIELVNAQPTADVKEVKRGHWIAKASTHISKRGRLIHYDRYKCSECGVWNGRHKQDFCPHCGADMRGEK